MSRDRHGQPVDLQSFYRAIGALDMLPAGSAAHYLLRGDA